VQIAVMPKGVEHMAMAIRGRTVADLVQIAVMPKGVEH
jgi:hypothetical protein